MSEPRRVQLKRERGYRRPADCFAVTRTGLLGNPFVGSDAVAAFRVWFRAVMSEVHVPVVMTVNSCFVGDVGFDVAIHPRYVDRVNDPEWRRRAKAACLAAKGKRPGCYCSLDKECHGDVIAEILEGLGK